MNQKPDATQIEAALKRAADKALHGTREERSGRFLKPGERRDTATERREAPRGPSLAQRKA